MNNKIEIFLTIDLTVLILALVVLLGRIIAALMKLLKLDHQYTKVYKLLLKQPYIIAILILIAYITIYQLSPLIPTINRSLGLTQFPKLIIHGVEVICFFLSILLIIKEEQIIYTNLQNFCPNGKFNIVLRHMRQSFRVLIFSLTIPFLLPNFISKSNFSYAISTIIYIIIIWSVAWLLIQSTSAAEKVSLVHNEQLTLTNYHARRIATQTKLLNKIVTITIVILTIAATCLIFDKARTFGTSMLASAGIATGIIGFAATKMLSNFLIGLQIAFTQPIKINDQVTIDGEFGVIEDISLNYVIIKIWDLKRLIMPVSYFIEKPFINYSRSSTDIISQVIFFTDYTLPIAEIRKYFFKAVSESNYWDKKTINLQIIELQENSVKVRGTASAANFGDAWNLKCEILEKLSIYLTINYPDSLPKRRWVEQ